MINVIRGTNKVLHYVAGIMLVALMVAVVIHVLGRHFLRPPRPVPGLYEMIDLAMVMIIYLGFGYAQHSGDHVTVDLLYERLGRIGRTLLDLVSGVFSIVVIGVIVWRLWEWALILQARGYITQSLGWPLAPAGFVGVAGAAFYLLAAAATAVVQIRASAKEAK